MKKLWSYLRRRPEDSPNKWLFIAAGWFLFILGGLNAIGTHSLVGVLNAFSVCVLGLIFLMLPRSLRHAYRHGWFSCRQATADSLSEASRRGMTWDEWVEAEQDRITLELRAMVDNP